MIANYTVAQQTFIKMGDRRGEAATHFEIGQYLSNHGKPQVAAGHLQKALEIRRQNETPVNVSYTLNAIGANYTLLKQPEKAAQSLFEALAIIKDKDQVMKGRIYKSLAAHYKQIGKAPEALDYQSKYLATTDTLIKEDQIAKMLKAQQRYEIEKRDNELAIQNGKIRISQLQAGNNQKTIALLLLSLFIVLIISVFSFYKYKEVQQKRTVRLRQRLSRDLHDDIGSTLSSISIYSELAKNETGRIQYLEAIKGHTQSVLSSLDDLVWGLQPKNDTISGLFDRMRLFAYPLLETRGITPDISFSLEADSPISIEHRTHLYLAFKEIINNVVKHAEATSCRVVCSQRGKVVSIEVRDNGKGFSETDATRKRNGLSNLRSRAKECNGTVTLNTHPQKGTSIVFTASLHSHKYVIKGMG